MKACLVTFSASYNFGASLQAFALQNKLKELYEEVEILDIRKTAHRKPEYYKGLKGLLLNPVVFLNKRNINEGNYAFERFSEKYFNLTKINYSDYSILENNPPKASIFISGSDQVFNPKVHSKTYMLDFVGDDSIKASFAASLGTNTVLEEDKNEFVRLLKRFDYLSIREKTSAKLIEELTQKITYSNIDPVFFYNEGQWAKLEKKPNIKGLKEKDYVLVYCVYRPKDINKTIRAIKKKTKKKVLIIERRATRFIFGGKLLLNCGPQEFLWLIRNAYFLYTTSFHGLAFGLIFQKKMIVQDNPTAPLRITDLLETLNAKDRLNYSIDEAINNNPKNVLANIEVEKEKNENYLKEIVKNVIS